MIYPDDFINKIVCSDCLLALKDIPENSIDLVVTSPPYDALRDYGLGWTIDLPAIGKEIFRILKDGGVAVMLIGDQTKNFKKSLTSFKTIINWCDEAKLSLFECNIYQRSAQPGAWWNTRFRVDHEYMPIFFKGSRPKFFDKEHLKLDARYGGQENCWGKVHKVRSTNNELIEESKVVNNPKKCRGTIWDYTRIRSLENMRKGKKSDHPASFPLQFPLDIISTFTKKDEVVLDMMCGSGTTCIRAKRLKRKYIGIDVSREYCDLAEELIKIEIVDK
jgi:DNA modification methylase